MGASRDGTVPVRPVRRPLPDGESTQGLIDRLRIGDRQALDVLLARLGPRLKRWAAGRLPLHAREGADTEDLVQDTLVHALPRLPTFESTGTGALHAYLRQAVLNRIRDRWRQWKRRPLGAPLDDDLRDPGASPLELTIGRDVAERYEAALARLRPDDRALIVARIEMGCSYAELAESLGKPSLSATRKATERALLRLATEMDRDA
jgi:RNA polymerase sigma-70 factor (ECF subfamily)